MQERHPYLNSINILRFLLAQQKSILPKNFYRFVEAIYFIVPAKRIRIKAIFSAIQRWDKLFKKFKNSGFETDKENFKVAKMQLQKMMIPKKKKSYFEDVLAKDRNKPEELEGFKATWSK